MTFNNHAVAQLFESLSDEELARRANSGGLTDEAQTLANAELENRHLAAPVIEPVHETVEVDTSPYDGDMVIVARYLEPTEAFTLCSCLQSAGVPAVTSDTHIVQSDFLLAMAFGGAKVKVPSNFEPEALEVIAAYKRGEFTLDDDFDVGELKR